MGEGLTKPAGRILLDGPNLFVAEIRIMKIQTKILVTALTLVPYIYGVIFMNLVGTKLFPESEIIFKNTQYFMVLWSIALLFLYFRLIKESNLTGGLRGRWYGWILFFGSIAMPVYLYKHIWQNKS